MNHDRTVSVAAALAERSGRVFLARRGRHKSSGGLWELPGGKVEAGERARDALARELREELALEPVLENRPYDEAVRIRNGVRYRFLVFRAHWEGEPSASTDHDTWSYFRPEDIPFGELAPLDEEVLRRWALEIGAGQGETNFGKGSP